MTGSRGCKYILGVIQHFILTRFNLWLWNQDKSGSPVRTRTWLDHRFSLFERFCLPSIIGQTCKDFIWIVLFDSTTPDEFKTRIVEFQNRCPQLTPIYVEHQDGRYFARIFGEEVRKRLDSSERVLTTYLDNDDALNIHFVEDIQNRAQSLINGTFITYIDGYQFYTDHCYAMRIHYPRNHFMSVVEKNDQLTVRTIYGFGSHYYIVKIPGVRIEQVSNSQMWCEVIHEKNMGNDAYFLRSTMEKDSELLHRDFAIDVSVKHSVWLYLFRFLPRYAKTFVRRVKYRLFGREW